MKTYIGIDNGVSGSIGITNQFGVSDFFKTPVKKEQDYTKKKKGISRIDVKALTAILTLPGEALVVLERPMVNPKMFNATTSALRAHEATLVVIEMLGLPHMFCDSKEWQKIMLPHGTKGKEDLKKASLDIGSRLFPQFKDRFKGDADGMLIAAWAKKEKL